VNRHELDVVSLLAGLVFVVLGGVGVLQGADVVDSGGAWAVIGALGAVGATGIVVSVRRLAASDRAEPVSEPVAETTAETPEETPEEEVVLDLE
jgi:hypothetical protein